MHIQRTGARGRLIVLLIIKIVASLCLLLPSHALSFEGPLWNMSQFPLFLAVDSPYLEKAAIEDSFSVRFSYSNIFLSGQSNAWTVYSDMEMSDLTFQYRKKISNLFEVGIDLPVLVFTSGFLDGFLNSFHNSFNLSDYGRPSAPDNRFRYEVSQNDNPVIKGQNGSIGLGDVRLTIKKPLLYDDPAVSIKADIEFPTGDAKRGYGSGSIDAGMAILADKRLGEKVKLYLNFGAVLAGDYKGYETVELRDFLFGGVALEATPWQRWSFVGQVSLQGAHGILPDTKSIVPHRVGEVDPQDIRLPEIRETAVSPGGRDLPAGMGAEPAEGKAVFSRGTLGCQRVCHAERW